MAVVAVTIAGRTSLAGAEVQLLLLGQITSGVRPHEQGVERLQLVLPFLHSGDVPLDVPHRLVVLVDAVGDQQQNERHEPQQRPVPPRMLAFPHPDALDHPVVTGRGERVGLSLEGILHRVGIMEPCASYPTCSRREGPVKIQEEVGPVMSSGRTH